MTAKKRKLRLDRTLGPAVIRWIEQELVHGPGDVQGQRIQLDDEQALFVMHCYELDDAGRRIVRRAAYSRPKGRAKSELAGMIACAEALGPVRFAGWDHSGRPLGMPVTSPLVKCVATEEGQASDNTYGKIEFMLREGAVSRTAGLDVGMTRTLLPGSGKIVPTTAKSSSKDGGLETFINFDETHLYTSSDLRSMFDTFRRNLGKRKQAQPWSLETSTMYAPGENSVAEATHRFAEAISSGAVKDDGFLFDHKQGPSKFNYHDDDQLRAALVQAYGEAAEWMDIERMIADARDPQTDMGDFIRYFVNIPWERTAGKWIKDEAWRACMSSRRIPEGAEVVVAVDAAHTRDTTACAWCWLAPDGRLVQRTRVWSCIESKPHDIFVPGGRLDNDLVMQFILEDLSDRYQVVLVLGDDHYFDDQMEKISDKGIPTVVMVQGSNDMRDAWNQMYGYVYSGKQPRLEVESGTVPAGAVYAAHVRNAVGTRTERGWTVKKRTETAPHDALTAGTMAAWGQEHIEDLVVYEGGVVYS